MTMRHNTNHENYDHLIGEDLWVDVDLNAGKIIRIDYFVDGYGHDVAEAVTETGRKVNCRRLVSTK